MLHKTIFATLIVILTMGVASAQNESLEDVRAGGNSWRTEQEKKNDIDTDRAYQSAIKRVPDTEKKKPDPWADVRPSPPAAPKNKQ